MASNFPRQVCAAEGASIHPLIFYIIFRTAARRLSFGRAALGGALAGLGAGAAPGLPGGARVDLAGGDIALPRTNVARTPAPGAMALLLSGLAGLIFALNRRR